MPRLEQRIEKLELHGICVAIESLDDLSPREQYAHLINSRPRRHAGKQAAMSAKDAWAVCSAALMAE